MNFVQLIADTQVVSYMFDESPLGFAYEALIDSRRVGLTGHSIAELRAGAVIDRWGVRKLNKHLRFLEQFEHVPCVRGMAEVCGAIRGLRRQIGEPIDWADASLSSTRAFPFRSFRLPSGITTSVLGRVPSANAAPCCERPS